MNQKAETFPRRSERGSAGVKLLVVGVIVVLLANAGWQYIPVAYNAESFKQEMSTAVVQAIALPASHGTTTEIVKRKIIASAETHNVPVDFQLDVLEQNEAVTARVHYVQKVPVLPFGIYTYDYVFDYTAAPNGFLTER
ncbi:MAG: hypothetical protein DWQ47_15750 [Acidobacteria bacterium]|nr:MAG: hypothetical protein DWQ32_03150 [Acidobacteriota bacterium]REK02488.1 MAG: hypothetical protein DWQ38_08985 [Acidobacteriota bacterium]REK13710.1 MAG: hypothetical protein DWQ43_08840 [Acidobacteriota bacterium]REK41704.1 MAG: hypothetical protein DWQ47_15750 [Acidobacteriota bacterium]